MTHLFYLELNWPAISAIGQLLAAGATVWAVIVALKGSQNAYIPKLKMSYSIKPLYYSGTPGPDELVIEVANIGLANVHLDNVEFLSLDNERLELFEFFSIRPGFPATISATECMLIHANTEQILAALTSYKLNGAYKFKFILKDSAGRKYTKKIVMAD